MTKLGGWALLTTKPSRPHRMTTGPAGPAQTMPRWDLPILPRTKTMPARAAASAVEAPATMALRRCHRLGGRGCGGGGGHAASVSPAHVPPAEAEALEDATCSIRVSVRRAASHHEVPGAAMRCRMDAICHGACAMRRCTAPVASRMGATRRCACAMHRRTIHAARRMDAMHMHAA
eukprot:366529-Chlamydomonas_euryale.AAC.10